MTGGNRQLPQGKVRIGNFPREKEEIGNSTHRKGGKRKTGNSHGKVEIFKIQPSGKMEIGKFPYLGSASSLGGTSPLLWPEAATRFAIGSPGGASRE